MDPEEFRAIWFTLACACGGVAMAAVPAFGMAWLLARRRWPGKVFIETLIALPLVIPPVATGLLLLELLGRHGPFGIFLRGTLGLEIPFTWRAVPVAMGVMALPLLVRSFSVALAGVDPRLEQVARTLGGGEIRVLRAITLPLALRGLLAGLVLGVARAIGEFGATVVLAGNIPGVTSTLALAMYRAIELGQDGQAFHLLFISVVLAFGLLWLSERVATAGTVRTR